jgi:AraC-like DNA-binding protein
MSHIFSYRDADLYSHHSIDPTPDPDAFSMHVHEMMEIYYFISGNGSYLVEGRTYPLESGDIMILRSAETHRLTITPSEPYERIAIHFSPAVLEAVDPSQKLLRPFLERPLGMFNHYSVRDPRCAHLQTIFRDFSFEKSVDIRLNLIGRLLLFLTELNGVFDQIGNLHNRDMSLSGRLVRYVNSQLFTQLSLQSVADHFYLSRSQISRIFRQATGSSFWEYVSIKRLMAAKAMLQRGEKASTVAQVCGFTDYSVFYRAYKNHFGTSPKEDIL